MPSDTRTPEEIERDIERERAELQHTVQDLQDRFSVDHFVRQVGDQLRENGGEISRSVGRAARDNPIALALTGVGLAWMMFGKPASARHVHAPVRHEPEFQHDHDRDRPRLRHASGYASNTGTSPQLAGRSHDRYRGGSASHMGYPDWAHDPAELDHDHSSGTSIGDRMSGAASRAKSGVSDAASGAKSGVAGAASGAREKVGAAASGLSDSASGAWNATRDGARDSAEAIRERAAAARERIARGTEHLSQEARNRVIAARERAIAARESARRQFSRGTDRAADFYDEHPLVVGALALAVGAAIAGALPRSRFEDEKLGAYSDDLFHEAERIFEEERAKAEKVVNAGVEEAKKVASDLKQDLDTGAPGDKTAAEAVKDKAGEAARQVADKTRDTAKQEGLGKPKVSS